MLRRRKTFSGVALGLAAAIALAVPAHGMWEQDRGVQVAAQPGVEEQAGLDLSSLSLPPVTEYRSEWVKTEPTYDVWACGPAFSPMGEEEATALAYESSFKAGAKSPGAFVKAAQLDFSSSDEAANAVSEFGAMLSYCDIEGKRTFSLDEGNVEGGKYAAFSYAAPEACDGDCDATWYHYMGFVRDGKSVVVMSYAVQAGPLPPEASMADEFEAMLASVR